MKEILKYRTPDGHEPFGDWFETLDWVSQARVDAYIVRASLGSSRKNIQVVGAGVYEIKINYGPGYRVYFSSPTGGVILLLLGGDKRTQARDIRKAIEYWRVYREKNDQL